MLLEAKRWLREVGAEFEPDVRVGRLSLAEKQLVEISKAVSTQAQILIMDEPTAVLSNREKAALFELIARLKKDGRSVILISHILSELVRHCDRISVLRDGEYVATVEAGSVTESELARMMVGRELGDLYPAIEPPGENVVVTLQTPDSRIELRAGEILGFGGLIGSGRTELWESLLGLRALAVGWAMTFSVRSRAAYVSEDRKGAGLHLEFSAEDNIALPWLGSFGPIKTDRRAVRCVAEKWREELSIKVADVGDRLGTLSGGNQQKVSLAKWLEGDPELLVLDEPTRGVDVGSKAQIYEIIAKLSRQGKALVVISSELPELLGLCHRVAVMKEGRIVAVLDRSELSEEAIMQHAAGVAI
jgi:ribose transport system ATP-binding protein